MQTGSMKCFKCGNIGHKRLSCPHKEREEEEAGTSKVNNDGGEQVSESDGGNEGISAVLTQSNTNDDSNDE